MIFSRVSRVSNTIAIIKSTFAWNPWIILDNSSIYYAGLDVYDFSVLIISLIALFVVERLSTKGNVREKLFKQNIVFRWIVIYGLVFSIIVFGCYGVGYDPASFIYKRFLRGVN